VQKIAAIQSGACGRKIKTTRRVELERFTVISSKPFEAVLVALKAAVGHPDMAEFMRATRSAATSADLSNTVQRGVGKTGLMLFMELDHGAILRKETELDTPKILRLLIGNSHHEGNGQTSRRCRIICPGHRPCG
jgi:hypothetical protein